MATTYTIQAEHMEREGFDTYSGNQAMGSTLVRATGHEGSLSTTFGGEAGTYSLTLNAQDESDGQSTLKIFVNGELVGTIVMDNDTDGRGSNNGSFTAFTLDGIAIPAGAEVEVKSYRDSGELVRIDSIGLVKTGELDGCVDIASNDFEHNANGWSDKWRMDAANGDTYLGGFGSTGHNGADTEKTFVVPQGAESLEISFDFLEIDSWDGESFFVFIDGHRVDLGQFWTNHNEGDYAFDAGNGISVHVDSIGHGNTGLGYGRENWTWGSDQVHKVTVKVEDPGDTVKLGFGSSLNQHKDDESWGVDNLKIVAKLPTASNTPEHPVVACLDFEAANGAAPTSTDSLVRTEAGLMGDAQISGGALHLDGHGDYAELSPNTGYAVTSGKIDIEFTSHDVWDKQGLFSRDSSGFDGGGHATIYIDDGRVHVRLQSDSHSYSLSSGVVLQDGVPAKISFEFGDNGMKLIVNGNVVDTDSYTGGLDGNHEPIVIGANQWTSGDNVADHVTNFFKGEIHDFKMSGEGPAPDGYTPLPLNFANLPNDGKIEICENETFVIDIETTEGDNVTYEIVPNKGDPEFFTIDHNTGELSFRLPPDYENPLDNNANNIYDVTVKITSSSGKMTEKTLWVKVRDKDPETPPAPEIDAVDDCIVVFESEGIDEVGGEDIEGNANDVDSILDNDTLEGQPYQGLVIEVAGQTGNVGDWIDIAKGRIKINADGTVDFDADGEFDGLNAGESDMVSVEYTIASTAGGGGGNGQLNYQFWNHVPGHNTIHNIPTQGGDFIGTVDDFDVNALALGLTGDGDTYKIRYTGTICIEEGGHYDFKIGGDDGVGIWIDGKLVASRDGLHGIQYDTGSIDLSAGVHSVEIRFFENYGGQGLDVQMRGADTGGSFDGLLNHASSDGFGGTVEDTTQFWQELPAGTIVADQYDGLTITGTRDGDTSGTNAAMVFDSNNPTGGDGDLGVNRGNILIISEDLDSSDPDDNAQGGVMTFDFDGIADLDKIRVVDIDHGETVIFRLFDVDGNLIKTINGGDTGNGGQKFVQLDTFGVSRMEVELSGSGGLDAFFYALTTPGEKDRTIEDTATVKIKVLGEDNPVVIDAVEDCIIVGENEGQNEVGSEDIEGNPNDVDSILDNDTLDGLPYEGLVIEVAGQTANIGEWVNLEKGRIKILADGTVDFDTDRDDDGDTISDFAYLNSDESETVSVEYTITSGTSGPSGPVIEDTTVVHMDFDGTAASAASSVVQTTAVLKNGASISDGALVLDGSNDYAEITPDQAFEKESGEITLSFRADAVNDGTLVSRDSSGFDGGGHLTVRLEDGKIVGRIQSSSTSIEVSSAAIVSTGTDYELKIAFGADGFRLLLDGNVVASDPFGGGLAGNNEPFTLGASQAVSGDGVANSLYDYFDGSISDFSYEASEVTQFASGRHVIDFDTDDEGNGIAANAFYANTLYDTLGVTISNGNGNQALVIQDTETTPSLDHRTDVQANALIVGGLNSSGQADERAGRTVFELDFNGEVLVESFVTGDNDEPGSQALFYDAAGALIGTVDIPEQPDGNSTPDSETAQTIAVNLNGVARMVLDSVGSTFLDDISFVRDGGEPISDTALVKIKVLGEDDPKVVDPIVVDAVDDFIVVSEDEGQDEVGGEDIRDSFDDTTFEESILDNDTEDGAPYLGDVIEVAGQTVNVGDWVNLEKGRIKINSDGTVDFDTDRDDDDDSDSDFAALNSGESETVSVTYKIVSPNQTTPPQSCEEDAADGNSLDDDDDTGSSFPGLPPGESEPDSETCKFAPPDLTTPHQASAEDVATVNILVLGIDDPIIPAKPSLTGTVTNNEGQSIVFIMDHSDRTMNLLQFETAPNLNGDTRPIDPNDPNSGTVGRTTNIDAFLFEIVKSFLDVSTGELVPGIGADRSIEILLMGRDVDVDGDPIDPVVAELQTTAGEIKSLFDVNAVNQFAGLQGLFSVFSTSGSAFTELDVGLALDEAYNRITDDGADADGGVTDNVVILTSTNGFGGIADFQIDANGNFMTDDPDAFTGDTGLPLLGFDSSAVTEKGALADLVSAGVDVDTVYVVNPATPTTAPIDVGILSGVDTNGDALQVTNGVDPAFDLNELLADDVVIPQVAGVRVGAETFLVVDNGVDGVVTDTDGASDVFAFTLTDLAQDPTVGGTFLLIDTDNDLSTVEETQEITMIVGPSGPDAFSFTVDLDSLV